MQLRSAAAADDAHRALDRAQDAQRAMRALSSPGAKPDQAPAPSYKPGDRRDMDRLIENAR
jgi:hypothetical protein